MAVRAIANAVEQVALTTLRTVLGQHTLDDILKAQDTISELMQKAIDAVTEPWGVKVERVQMKSVEIPPSMQRAMAQEAEALREKRARLIKAEAELAGAEQNTMTIVMMPSEFVSLARSLTDLTAKVAAKS